VPGDAVPPLADELDPSLFSVVQHPDGPMLKIGDWPLYYFSWDDGPGQTQGQGVGDVWWMVAPDGTLIDTQP
jgi:predicted lipoprotein with Yx(FWY)xxD motif